MKKLGKGFLSIHLKEIIKPLAAEKVENKPVL
jgi:hypothetical protein